jgi:hypothetical protein
VNNLIAVIGKAPTEALEEFLRRLKAERLRISQGIQDIRDRRKTLGKGKVSKKKASPKVSKKTVSLLEDIDDLDDFFAFVKAEKEKGGNS